MKKLMLAALILAMTLPAWAGETITLATLDWEPYIGQSMENNGYVAAVVKEAFKRGGKDVTLQFHQWSRTVGLAKAGKVDGYVPEYYAEGVEAYAIFSDPFPGGPLGFFKLKGREISYDRLEDLKGLKIGTVKGYVNTKEFDEAPFLTKDPVKDDMTNFKKLAAGRIDLLVADKFVGMHLVKTQMPEKAGDVEFMAKPLQEMDLYVCISKKKANARDLISAFNKGLKEMKSDGTIDKILDHYGFK